MRTFAVLSLTSIGNHELHAGVHANGIIATVVFIEVCQHFQNVGLTETDTDTYTHVHASTHKHTDP